MGGSVLSYYNDCVSLDAQVHGFSDNLARLLPLMHSKSHFKGRSHRGSVQF